MRRRGARRWIVNPVATAVLLAALVVDAALLPTHPLAGGVSTVGQWVEALACRARRTTHFAFYDTLVVKDGAGMRVLQPNIDSWDEATKLIAARPEDVALLDYTPRIYPRGFWAITREDFTHEIRFVEGGSALTEADRLAARGAMLDALFGPEAGHGEVLRRLRREDFSGTQVLWGGVLHNVLALGAFVLMAWSLQWVPPALAARRRGRAAAALARGACPRCGYSIAGLAVPVCPECGATLKEEDPGDVPGS